MKDLYQYVEVRLELAKLETEERFSKIAALITQLLIVVVMLGIVGLFMSIAFAFYLNTFSFAKNAPYIGFMCVAGFYLLVLIFILILGGRFRRSSKYLLRKSFKQFIEFATKKDE